MIRQPPDGEYLAMAARLAARGRGGAEPNPLVGCVIVGPAGSVVGWGYHRQCGGPHAEVEALRRAGPRAAGATAYVTLEPCNHAGRTGPCTEALIDAAVARVVYARPDPSSGAGGGAERLRSAGIEVQLDESCPPAIEVSAPFVRRVRDGLPWVIAKWAQTVDGRIATPSGESRWISNPASRGIVHRLRGRVDAILTAIGTVDADDPMLTARGVRLRRAARRVVVDPGLATPLDCRLVATADRYPTSIICRRCRYEERSRRAAELEARGVELIPIDAPVEELPLTAALRDLVRRHEVTNVLVEAGPGLLGRLFRDHLVNEAWVFIAPLLLGDDEAVPCVRGMTAATLTQGCPLELRNVRRRGGDVLLRYRVL